MYFKSVSGAFKLNGCSWLLLADAIGLGMMWVVFGAGGVERFAGGADFTAYNIVVGFNNLFGCFMENQFLI